MAAKGNSYQQVISYVLDCIDKTGQIPEDLRDLVRKSGLTGPEIIASFPTHRALLSALIDHGVVLLADAIRDAAVNADPADPRAQLRAMGQALFIWGDQNRSLFTVLASALVDPNLAEGTTLDMYRNSIRDLVIRKLLECRAMGLLDPETDIDLLAANTHSLILGISSMLIYDRKDAWYHLECNNVSALAIRMMDQFVERMVSVRAPHAF